MKIISHVREVLPGWQQDTINSFRGKYRFLSNFFSTVVWLEGMRFETVENAYQAAKTSDHELRVLFSKISPQEAKKAGADLRSLRPDWGSMKVNVMSGLLLQKFGDLVLRQKLLETGNSRLVETNDWGDQFWGVCAGRGRNTLGFLLMAVRHYYRMIGDGKS